MSGFTKLPDNSMPRGFDPERFYDNTVGEFLTGLGAPNIEERSKDLKKEVAKTVVKEVPEK